MRKYILYDIVSLHYFHLYILSFFLNVFNKIVDVDLQESVAVMNDIKSRQWPRSVIKYVHNRAFDPRDPNLLIRFAIDYLYVNT